MDRMKKEKLILGSIAVIVVVTALSAFSLAALKKKVAGSSGKVVYKAGDLNVILDETGATDLVLENATPTKDSQGESQTPYKFSIKNNSTSTICYELYLANDTTALDECSTSSGKTCETLADSQIKYQLTRGSDKKTTFLPTDRLLATGQLTAGTSDSYQLKVWLDYDADNSAMGKYFFGRVKVEATQCVVLKTPLETVIADNTLQKEKAGMFNYSNDGQSFNGSKVITDSAYVLNGLFSSSDDEGTSYYYRGNVKNNNVQFGEYQGNKMYWKIIRINGDGSMRLLYNGINTNDSYEYSEDEQFLLGQDYNMDYYDPKYAGYTYDGGTSSYAKEQVDNWYSQTLAGTIYDSKVINGRFCSDSSGYKPAYQYNMGTDGYYFASADRLYQYKTGFAKNNAPTLKCPATSEDYGGSYSLKAGLITADELVFAGLSYWVVSTSYLNYGGSYYSMTPAWFVSEQAYIFFDYGDLSPAGVNSSYDIRPVINLKADIKFESGGDGTASNPYVVSP